ncbi:hypothetical protein [Woodsholea maritima]|uniref:hypothetical protein n=1 Tax=Woodsholea maritima TaxID=240237 RepID=UPI0012EA4760|nr:hypothetical protein [Woodsholea maritima]
MKTTDNGILQIVLAFIMMGLIIGALIGSRGPILALERMEGHVMVWIYNRSHIAGMIVYWGLMIAVALLGGTLMRAVAMTLDQMFKWGLSAWMFYAGGAVLSVIFRMVYHPLSAQVDVFGRPKVENVVEAGMYESDIAPSDPENHETPQG